MSTAIRYVAEPTHVREVSLLGTADLDFWTARLREEKLQPVQQCGQAQILIIAGEMTYMGIRFTEVSFAVFVSVPEDRTRNAAFLIHAFNSCRLFAFCERQFFATPYSHAECRVSVSEDASIRVSLGGKTIFRAHSLRCPHGNPRAAMILAGRVSFFCREASAAVMPGCFLQGYLKAELKCHHQSHRFDVRKTSYSGCLIPFALPILAQIHISLCLESQL
jgi:hypothetical protein